jgi:hypothetical protein
MRSKTVLFLCLFLIVLSAKSQHPAVFGLQNQGKFGLTASIGNQSQGVSFLYWITPGFVVSPSLGFSYLSRNELDVTLGLSTRHYFRVEQTSAYLGLRIGTMLLKPYKDPNDTALRTDLFAGMSLGVEHYFNRFFSLGLEIQGDFLQSDERSERFDNSGGVGAVLRPVIMATFYF